MSNAMMPFYDNVEAERARNRWTIAECAEKLKIDEKTYRNRRDNLSDLYGNEIQKYAELFDCSIDYLFGRTDKIRVAK